MTWVEELFQRARQQGTAAGWVKALNEGYARGFAEGFAEGKAEALLLILSKRGVPVDANARQRILSCTDLATLYVWAARALKVTSLSEILDGPAQ